MYPPLKKRKKPNKTGMVVLIACGAALLIVLAVALGARSPRKTLPPSRPVPSAPVSLSETQKKEMYESLWSLKAMLRANGGDPDRSYQILSDRYRIPMEAVREVEGEGRRRGWRRPG